MAGWKASALGLVGVLILAAHPGCIASTESLAVAPRRSGDAVELTTKVDRYHAGRESHDGISGPIEVEHVQESSTVRTAYTRGVEQDRFLRDADAVALLVDLHTEFQRDQDRGWYEYQQRSVFELASAEPLFVDYIRSAANYGADDCGACGATHSNEQR